MPSVNLMLTQERPVVVQPVGQLPTSVALSFSACSSYVVICGVLFLLVQNAVCVAHENDTGDVGASTVLSSTLVTLFISFLLDAEFICGCNYG